MEAGKAQFGRKFLAALVAAMLVASVMFLFAEPPALANHAPPDDVVEQVGGPNGTNETPYWVTYLENERGITGASCEKLDISSGDAFVMPAEPDGEDWVLLVVKQATTNYVYYDPAAGHTYPSTGQQGPGYSHIIVCSVEEPEDTTTTTEPEETTTTQPEETTTTQPEETTTVPEETTTTVPEETTTTVPEETTTTTPTPEVLGLVIVTVESTCTVDDDQGVGQITVTISVPDGATVVIRDSNGAVIDTVTSDAVITVPEGATYTWEATVSEGSEFPVDFVPNGELDIESCTPDEVDDVETLPFTGVDTDLMAILAASLGMLGGLVLLATRQVEEN